MMMLTQDMDALSLYNGPAFSLKKEESKSKKRNKICQWAASSSSSSTLAIEDRPAPRM